MAGCPYCGKLHAPLYICDERKRAMANSVVANRTMANGDVANTYRYRDAERRRAYMREYMRRRRGR